MSQTKNPNDPYPEDIRKFALAIADDLRQFLNSLMQILKYIEGEDFGPAGAQTVIDQTFIDLCGDYPGSVNIRRSGERFEELKGLDWEELQILDPHQLTRVDEERLLVPSSEQGALISSKDRVPVDAAHNTNESPSKISKEPEPPTGDSPMEMLHIGEKAHPITPVAGYDLGEEEADSVPAKKVADKVPKRWDKSNGAIESLRRLLTAQKMQTAQDMLPILSSVTSRVAPLEDFPGVTTENIDEEQDINSVGAAFEELYSHDNTDVHLTRQVCHPDPLLMRVNVTSDIERGISHCRIALKATVDGDLNKPEILNQLAIYLELRFRHSHIVDDLQEAASSLQTALELTPDGHPTRPALLANVGNILQTRFVRNGDVTDREQAILHEQQAVNLTPDAHPTKPRRRQNLANSLQSRFRLHENVDDLELAISLFQEAVDLTPDNRLDRSILLENLASAMNLRFRLLGRLSDLEDYILILQNAVDIVPDGHHGNAQKPSHLHQLGDALEKCFEYGNNIQDLSDVISNYQGAVQLTPDGDVSKPHRLHQLGGALQKRYVCLKNPDDLEGAISNNQKAVELATDSHPEKAVFLNGLGDAQSMRFELLGDDKDLESAISNLYKAAELTPRQHQDGNLRTMRPKQLEEAKRIQELRQAELARPEAEKPDQECSTKGENKSAKTLPSDHTSRLVFLADTLMKRFNESPNEEDLKRAISYYQKAVDFTPDHHSDKPSYLTLLGDAFMLCFEHFGDPDHLDQAISNQEKALTLTPNEHPSSFSPENILAEMKSGASLDDVISKLQKSGGFSDGSNVALLIHCGMELQTRFERLGNPKDLESAISILQRANDLTAQDHKNKPLCHCSLGGALLARFGYVGNPEDLQNAIVKLRESVKLIKDGDPSEPIFLNTLGRALLADFEHCNEYADINTVISTLETAVNLTPKDDPKRLHYLHDYGNALRVQDASESPISAYTCAINLLPLVAPLGSNITHQHAVLAKVGGIARDAVAAGILHDKPIMGLEWAEQVRSIVWQNLLSLRALLHDLRRNHPELAHRLQEISEKMEKPYGDAVIGSKEVALPTEDVARMHSALALEWQNTLKEVRKKPHFESFLMPKTFDALRDAARDGPVVILNVQDSRCDALVLIERESNFRVNNIPLESFSYQTAQELLETMKSVLSSARIKPVIKGLRYSVELDNPPRIWWCPTGPLAFLPIHAAGLYNPDTPGEKVSDYVISSYTPNLTSILSQDRDLGEDFQLLTVALPSISYAPSLPCAKEEVERIHSLAEGVFLVELMDESATVARVKNEIKKSDWIHLACHGEQVANKAMASGFLLHDKKLELSKMLKMSLPRADFAFLSACQTATGDETIPEESMHLASGMLFAGYRGVIATMWSINDNDAPVVAEDVYRQVLKDGKPNRKGAARALHEALKRLRAASKGAGEDAKEDFLSWVPFIHIGR
ncbi:hypothetical protein M408DRAFT_25203 [Serendipita vermifera MAFF 305830]|uniref:CHAT domain-containing protein n=1 Tax=Serendipita vermifera MAFF 305830 TaxID=933852 RepID=A0A0C3B3H4_SERVB|nr:hypothetical protein M408DRAFT_25203 [Serendipita vermifera MAFF 305830]